MPFGRGRCWHIEGEVHWRIVELTEIDYGFQKKGRKFLSSWATVSWSRRALLHGIGNNNNNIRPVYSYYELPELVAVDRLILTMCYYLGADKSLARPGRKQVRKHVRNARDFNNIETRAVKNVFLARQGAEGNLRHSDRNISLFPSWWG
jgi:hypothetical protein